MDQGAIRRAVLNVQKHNKNNMSKFKEDFKDLFKEISQACKNGNCFDNQKASLKTILQDAAFIEYRSNKFNEMLDFVIQDTMTSNTSNDSGNSSNDSDENNNSNSNTAMNVSLKLHESMETLPVSCTQNDYNEQEIYQGFSTMFDQNESRNNVMMGGDSVSDDDLEIVQDAVALSDKCDITGIKMAEPMRSKKCNHVFSKQGLIQWFRISNRTKCPAAACRMDGTRGNKLKLSDFVPDHDFFQRVEESQRRAEASQYGSRTS